MPSAVIIKKPTDEKIKKFEMMAKFFDGDALQRVHNTELNAYEYLTGHGPPPIPMAKCLHKEKITAPGTGMLILEAVQGRSLTFNEDLSVEQAIALSEHIASLQAYGFQHPDLARWGIGAIPINMVETFVDNVPDGAKTLRKKYPDLFSVSDEAVEKGLRLCHRTTELMMNPDKNPYVKAVSLGDMQPNNVLWKENEDGTLSNEVAALLDFQLCHEGVTFYDLSAIISWGLSIDDHDAHIDKVIEHYYKKLTENLGNTPPVSLREFRRGYNAMRVMYSTIMIQFISEMEQHKDMFGISDERIRAILTKITHGFLDIDKDEVVNL